MQRHGLLGEGHWRGVLGRSETALLFFRGYASERFRLTDSYLPQGEQWRGTVVTSHSDTS